MSSNTHLCYSRQKTHSVSQGCSRLCSLYLWLRHSAEQWGSQQFILEESGTTVNAVYAGTPELAPNK